MSKLTQEEINTRLLCTIADRLYSIELLFCDAFRDKLNTTYTDKLLEKEEEIQRLTEQLCQLDKGDDEAN